MIINNIFCHRTEEAPYKSNLVCGISRKIDGVRVSNFESIIFIEFEHENTTQNTEIDLQKSVMDRIADGWVAAFNRFNSELRDSIINNYEFPLYVLPLNEKDNYNTIIEGKGVITEIIVKLEQRKQSQLGLIEQIAVMEFIHKNKENTKIYLEASIMNTLVQRWLDWSRKNREDIIINATENNRISDNY